MRKPSARVEHPSWSLGRLEFTLVHGLAYMPGAMSSGVCPWRVCCPNSRCWDHSSRRDLDVLGHALHAAAQATLPDEVHCPFVQHAVGRGDHPVRHLEGGARGMAGVDEERPGGVQFVLIDVGPLKQAAPIARASRVKLRPPKRCAGPVIVCWLDLKPVRLAAVARVERRCPGHDIRVQDFDVPGAAGLPAVRGRQPGTMACSISRAEKKCAWGGGSDMSRRTMRHQL